LLVGLVAGIRFDEHGNRRQAVGEDEVQAFRRIQLDLPAHAGGAPEAWQRIAEYPVALVDTTAVTGSDMMHVPVLGGLQLDADTRVVGRDAQLELGEGEALQQLMASVAQRGLEQHAAALVYPELMPVAI